MLASYSWVRMIGVHACACSSDPSKGFVPHIKSQQSFSRHTLGHFTRLLRYGLRRLIVDLCMISYSALSPPGQRDESTKMPLEHGGEANGSSLIILKPFTMRYQQANELDQCPQQISDVCLLNSGVGASKQVSVVTTPTPGTTQWLPCTSKACKVQLFPLQPYFTYAAVVRNRAWIPDSDHRKNKHLSWQQNRNYSVNRG